MPVEIAHRIAHASGFARDDYHALLWRYDARYGPDGRNCESWAVEVIGWRPRIALAVGGLMGSIWRSPSGRVLATDGTTSLHVYDHDDPPGTPRWQALALSAPLEGVWGLHDDFVLAWGPLVAPTDSHSRRDGSDGHTTVVHHWDGREWSVTHAPGRILAIHGVSPAEVWAVGESGFVARWARDGWQWPEVDRLNGALWSVFAGDDGEVWACGPHAGLARLTPDGWKPVATFGLRTACVARWNGTLWVGARSEGLHRLDGDSLVLVDPAIEAESFDARAMLLVTTPTAIHQGTFEGTFERTGLRAFEGLGRDDAPRWDVLPDEDREIDPDKIPDVDW